MSSGKGKKLGTYVEAYGNVDPGIGMTYHGAKGDWKEVARTSQFAAPAADWDRWTSDPLKAAGTQAQRIGGTRNWSPFTGQHNLGAQADAEDSPGIYTTKNPDMVLSENTPKGK